MRINHRYDARARISTVNATDLLRRYAFAPVGVAISSVVPLETASVLPRLEEQERDDNREICRFDLSSTLPEYAVLKIDFVGLFTERGTLSLIGDNITANFGQSYSLTASGTTQVTLRLSDGSKNVFPAALGPQPTTVQYKIEGIRIHQQVETINNNVSFTRTLNQELRFPQPFNYTRTVTDYRDNP